MSAVIQMEDSVLLQIAPSIAGLDSTDERLQPYISELLGEIDQASVPWTRAPSTPGTKGSLQEILINLSDPTSVVAICGAIALWLRRAGDRSVRLTLRKEDATSEVHVEAKNVTDETLREMLKRAEGQLNRSGG